LKQTATELNLTIGALVPCFDSHCGYLPSCFSRVWLFWFCTCTLFSVICTRYLLWSCSVLVRVESHDGVFSPFLPRKGIQIRIRGVSLYRMGFYVAWWVLEVT